MMKNSIGRFAIAAGLCLTAPIGFALELSRVDGESVPLVRALTPGLHARHAPALAQQPGVVLRNAPAAGDRAITQIIGVRSVAVTGTSPTAQDNDFVRLNAVLQGAPSGAVIEIEGEFDWREPFAAAAWAAGADAVAGNGDDYALLVAPGRSQITLTASGPLGTGSVVGPGDLADVDLEGFLYLFGGGYQGWQFRGLEIRGFDLGIGMFFDAGGTANDFDDVQVTGNRFVLPTDLPAASPGGVESLQNIGLHYAFGRNQWIAGNLFEIAGDGVSAAVDRRAATVAMQSNTSGGPTYDGLIIENNRVDILAAPSAMPERVIGIWENGHAHQSDIRVRGNTVISAAPGDVLINDRTGFRITSHSSDSSLVSYRNNVSQGLNIGFRWLDGSVPASVQRLEAHGNTVVANATGFQMPGSGSNGAGVDLQWNRVAGNGIGIADGAGLVEISAERNWWGCSAGPGQPGCDALLNEATPAEWLVATLAPQPLIVSPPANVPVAFDVRRSNLGNDHAAVTRFPNGTAVAFATSFGSLPAVGSTLGARAQVAFTAATPGLADVTATLDSETLATRIVVSDGATVLCVPTLFDARCQIDYPTIQGAFDAAQPGFVVLIDEGIYPEQLVIDTPNLTVQGAGAAHTIIRPAAVSANTTSLSSGAALAPIVLVRDAVDVAISELAIDGAAASSSITGCTPGYIGAYYRNGGGTLDAVVIENLLLAPNLVGCQAQNAVYIHNNGVPVALTVRDSIFRNYGKNGITANEAGTSLTVADSIITGRGPVPLGAAAQNGVQIGFGATGSVSGSTISAHSYLPATTTATGVLVYAASATIEDNTLGDNQIGLYAIDGNAIVRGNLISATQATTGVSTLWAAVFDDPPASRRPAPFEPTPADQRGTPPGAIVGVFEENRLISDGLSADSVGFEGDAGYGSADVEVTLSRNEIRGFGTGVVLFDCGAGGSCTASDFVAANLHCNRIVGNGEGLSAAITIPVVSENNWWGCNAGPGGVAGCNGVAAGSSAVDADPWLVLGLSATPSEILLDQGAQIDADLRRNSAGVDVSANCTLPPTDAVLGADIGTLFESVLDIVDGAGSMAYLGTQAGLATVTATLDQQASTTTVVVSERPDVLFGDGFED